MQAQSTGEDSNSSDTAMSDHGDPVTPKTEPSDYPMLDDHHPFNTNGGLIDQTRTPTFPGALLGLQGKILYFIITSKYFHLWANYLVKFREYKLYNNRKMISNAPQPREINQLLIISQSTHPTTVIV